MAYPYVSEREVRIISEHFGDPEARTLDGARARGRYDGLKKALGMSPDEVIDVVKQSGLRGRGGAGFPTGLKWSFMPKDTGKPHYLCCNADESEPGTFKDRELIRWDPHQLIEGCLIAAYAIRAEHTYIYCRGEFFETNSVLAKAVEDAYGAGLCGEDALGSGQRLDVTVHVGAGAYICGEETGLMNSLEGRRGEPRVQAPVSGRGRRIRDADHREQRRDTLLRPPHREARSGLVPAVGIREESRHQAVLRERDTCASPATTSFRSASR